MSLVTPADWTDYGGTGTFDTADVQMATDLAEFDVENALSFYITPTTLTEEYLWPLTDGKILLSHGKVNSITTVTAKHTLDANCIWTEDEECGVILNRDEGLVKVVSCNFSLGQNCNCVDYFMPDRLVITYVSGLTAAETLPTTKLGKALRMAVILRAREWLQAISLGDAWEGMFAILSWNSMDYGERREYAEKLNPLGPGPLSRAAYQLLYEMKGKPAIFLRSSGRY